MLMMCARQPIPRGGRVSIVAREPSTWAVLRNQGRPTELRSLVPDAIARTHLFATGGPIVRIHTPGSIIAVPVVRAETSPPAQAAAPLPAAVPAPPATCLPHAWRVYRKGRAASAFARRASGSRQEINKGCQAPFVIIARRMLRKRRVQPLEPW